MARKARFNLPGIPQHIIQRGNNREPCFYAVGDYQRYLGDLTDAANRNTCRIHAYVLMTNHVHVLVTPMAEYGPLTSHAGFGSKVCALHQLPLPAHRYTVGGTLQIEPD